MTVCTACVSGFYARDPPPSVVEGSGRHGAIGSVTGCTQCSGTADVPLYSRATRDGCELDCPMGQYGMTFESTISALVGSMLANEAVNTDTSG